MVLLWILDTWVVYGLMFVYLYCDISGCLGRCRDDVGDSGNTLALPGPGSNPGQGGQLPASHPCRLSTRIGRQLTIEGDRWM